jgi:predicted dehydrogenase
MYYRVRSEVRERMHGDIGVCVVGLGAGRVHSRVLSSLKGDGVRLFVCDISEEKARAVAKEYGAEAWFLDYKEALARDDVDAMSICLPHHLHWKAAVESADAGKHVLVEKPMARTLKEADAMIAAAKKAGVKLMVAEHHRYIPSVLKAKELIDNGSLGEIFLIRCNLFTGNRASWPLQNDWRSENEKRGGGVLLSDGVHRVNVLRTLGGDVASVYCLFPPTSYFDGEHTAFLSIKFKSGVMGSLVHSWATRLKTLSAAPWFSVFGTEGSALSSGYDQLSVYSTKLPECSEGPVEMNIEKRDIVLEEIKDFLDSIRTGREPLVSGKEGRKDIEVCLAGYKSVQEGRVKNLPMST